MVLKVVDPCADVIVSAAARRSILVGGGGGVARRGRGSSLISHRPTCFRSY